MANISELSARNNMVPEYSAKGFSGLASGMDTESVVEKMTQSIQLKIDRLKKAQTKNTWKQEAYREVIDALTAFQSKYFSFSNPATNLLSTGLYNTSRRVPQGANADKVSVVGRGSNHNIPFKISSIEQIAEKTRYIGKSGLDGSTISTGEISFSDRDVNVLEGAEIEITYDNVKYTLRVPSGKAIPKNAQNGGMASLLNEALNEVHIRNSSDKLSTRLLFTPGLGGTLELRVAKETDTRRFEITEENVNILNKLGLKKGDHGNGSTPIRGTAPVSVIETGPFSLSGKDLIFSLDGLNRRIRFSESDNKFIMHGLNIGTDPVTDEARLNRMSEVLNKKLKIGFGDNKVNVTVDGNRLNIKVTDETSILNIGSNTADTLGATGIFGMEHGISNRLNMDAKLSSLKDIKATVEDPTDPSKNIYKIVIGGSRELIFTGDTRLGDVIKAIDKDPQVGLSVNYLRTTNRFSITADESGANGKISIRDSTGVGNLAAKLFGLQLTNPDSSITDEQRGIIAGKDLKMTIKYDGDASETVIVRNSNEVTIDGLNINVKGVFSNSEAISFKNESDTENAVKVIKEMAEEYNKILEKVNSYISTKPALFKGRSNRRYEPLSDSEKKRMTEDEVKKWEEKAKEGILFGDSTLSQLASSMRFAFSFVVGGQGTGKSIGISTSSSYADNGKIVIDENKLKSALANDPEKVRNIFTASAEEAPTVGAQGFSGGFATRVKSIFESYATLTGSYKGKLVSIAGLKNNNTTNDNLITRNQRTLEDKINRLETLLSKSRDRYQKRFTTLERYISKMNSQSSWLAANMGM